jgi:hypothetical protein
MGSLALIARQPEIGWALMRRQTYSSDSRFGKARLHPLSSRC